MNVSHLGRLDPKSLPIYRGIGGGKHMRYDILTISKSSIRYGDRINLSRKTLRISKYRTFDILGKLLYRMRSPRYAPVYLGGDSS